ncbi:MAG: transposase, partial [Planctomycetota bacterium]
ARLPRVTAGTAALDGFTLHNEVRIAGRDRGRLERLIRYMCRPPLANGWLSMSDDGRVRLELRRPFSDGTTQVLFAPLTFIEKRRSRRSMADLGSRKPGTAKSWSLRGATMGTSWRSSPRTSRSVRPNR